MRGPGPQRTPILKGKLSAACPHATDRTFLNGLLGPGTVVLRWNLRRPRNGASKIRLRRAAKKKTSDCSEQQNVHCRAPGRMQQTDHEVESHPDDKQPPRPVAATEHEHAAHHGQKQSDVTNCMLKWMLRPGLGDTLAGGRLCRREQSRQQDNAAKRDEYPTDDGDWKRSFAHRKSAHQPPFSAMRAFTSLRTRAAGRGLAA